MNRSISRSKGLTALLVLIFTLGMTISASFAQGQRRVTGKVIDAKTGEAMLGVSIQVKNTKKGTMSDANGNFTIDVANGASFVVSFVGYQTTTIPLGTENNLTIRLEANDQSLEEVVVIGYGVQKKKLLTGANISVKGSDLQKQSTTNALQALQGQAPGVQISATSGQPGEGLNVIIRGKGTIGGVGPLYVVDGIQTGDISYLNPADIESIDVLKDAASAAIYGSQSANGVVLVTTKSGKGAGSRAQISFDGFWGQQRVASKARLLNATEYGIIMNEAAVNSGKSPYFTPDQINTLGKGTNWMDEMFVDDAVTQNYTFSAQGNTDYSSYSTSLAYTGQEGVVGGKGLSNYERYNLRVNSDHKLYKNIITLSQNLSFAYIKNNGIGVGNQYNNSLRAAFNTSPFVPMYDTNGNFFDNSNSTWYNGEANPYATMYYTNQNMNNNQRLLGNLTLGVNPMQGLSFKSTLGIDYGAGEGRSYLPVYQLSIYSFNKTERVYQSMNKGQSITWDNSLTYDFVVAKDHKFQVMAGTSAYQYSGSNMNGNNTGLIIKDLNHAWLSNATNTNGALIGLGGGPNTPDKRLSAFGRLSYNYKETYLLNATFRADGSSRFASGNRWGYFPSVSAGWVATNEEFLKGASSWLNFLKIRASWGQVGNQNIAAFQYLAPINFDNTNYEFGVGEGILTPGAYPSRLGNTNLKWEVSQQTDIGLDATFLQNRLSFNFDYYIKDTKDWLIAAPILATAGADAPFINGGDVRNSGIELALTFRDRIGDFSYSVGVNGAYNKNKVGNIPTGDGIVHGPANLLYDQSLEFYRAQNGFPIGYFWGIKTDGIFQNEQAVRDHKTAAGGLIQPNAQPGDVRYVDLNGDGIINDNDRTMIGKPNPDYTYGINLSASYKGFDFSVLASGVIGADIVQSYRNITNYKANYMSSILDRWHGEGTSNSIPRVTEDNRNWAQFSDQYIKNGDFLRINNVTLGYDFGRIIKKKFMSQVRLYVAAQNLYTFTKYDGMDPEVGYNEGFSSNVDLGFYPRPRTFMFGANIKF